MNACVTEISFACAFLNIYFFQTKNSSNKDHEKWEMVNQMLLNGRKLNFHDKAMKTKEMKWIFCVYVERDVLWSCVLISWSKCRSHLRFNTYFFSFFNEMVLKYFLEFCFSFLVQFFFLFFHGLKIVWYVYGLCPIFDVKIKIDV